MGGAMLSKSLIQFSAEGWGCVRLRPLADCALHADATQALFKVPVDVRALGVRMLCQQVWSSLDLSVHFPLSSWAAMCTGSEPSSQKGSFLLSSGFQQLA